MTTADPALRFTPVTELQEVISNPVGEVGATLYSRNTQQTLDLYESAGGADYPSVVLNNAEIMAPSAVKYSGFCNAKNLDRGLGTMLRTVGSYLPPLRQVAPCGLPSETEVLYRRKNATYVTAIAFHEHTLDLAVAVRSPNSGEVTVQIYDVAGGQFAEGKELRHYFAHNVEKLAWKPRSRNVLAVGVQRGCLVWDTDFKMHDCQAMGPELQTVLAQRKAVGFRKKDPRDAPQLHRCLKEEIHSIADGACIFYRTSCNTPTTSIAFTNNSGRFMALGSHLSYYIDVFDVSQPPTTPPVAVVEVPQGYTKVLTFTSDDRFLLQGPADSATLQCWSTQHWRRHVFSTAEPLLQVCPIVSRTAQTPDDVFFDLESMHTGRGSCFVFALEKTEGIAIGQVYQVSGGKKWRHWRNGFGLLGDVEFSVLARVNLNGVVDGIRVQGPVVQMAAHCIHSGSRVAVEVESGHVILLHVAHGSFRVERDRIGTRVASSATIGNAASQSFEVRGVGIFDAKSLCTSQGGGNKRSSEDHGIVNMTFFNGCPMGSLLAFQLSTGEIRFLPMYYR